MDLKISERIRKAVENSRYQVENGDIVNVTLSIGIYEFNKSDLSFIDGVNFADLTMYRAKFNKKNKVMVF